MVEVIERLEENDFNLSLIPHNLICGPEHFASLLRPQHEDLFLLLEKEQIGIGCIKDSGKVHGSYSKYIFFVDRNCMLFQSSMVLSHNPFLVPFIFDFEHINNFVFGRSFQPSGPPLPPSPCKPRLTLF